MTHAATKTFRIVCLVSIAMVNCGASFAETESAVVTETDRIYESLREIPIGKIFFSSAQRRRLDQIRGTPSQSTPSAGTASARTQGDRKREDKAAGYIVSNRGKVKVYSRGDFVTDGGEKRVEFPGAVKISRVAGGDKVLQDNAKD